MILRDYQLDAVNACARALRDSRSCVIVAATGAGKSLIIAHICQRILNRYSTARVLCLCYVQEILEGNHEACLSLGLESGIYCAGLGRRDKHQRVIHASRDSLGNNPQACGQFDCILVDEAHLCSSDADTRYAKIIDTLAPRWLIGLTATPYRLDGGLIYGRKKLFETLAFDISHTLLVQKGYLVPYTFPPRQATLVDSAQFKVIKGEFDTRQVDAVVSDKEIINASLATWWENAKGRTTSLFFCHSLRHADLCFQTFKRMFPTLEACYLDGTTDKKDRAYLIKQAKKGRYKAIFQVQTMTTGTNIPCIDCVVWLRPTRSASLFVQGCGRGSRLSENKNDCLVIDVVGNVDRFGDIYTPNLPPPKPKARPVEFTDDELLKMGIDPKHMKGQPVTKECPKCGTYLHAAAKSCFECGKLFISVTDPYTGAGPGEILPVISATAIYTATHKGERCYKVTYVTPKGVYHEWILYTRPWARGTYSARKKLLSADGTEKITHIQTRPSKKKNYPHITPLSNPDETKQALTSTS